METIAYSRVEQLLIRRGGRMFRNKVTGRLFYLMPNDSVVRMPENNARFPEMVVKEIAEIKLDMSPWEYDYWLTHQDQLASEDFLKVHGTLEGVLKAAAKHEPQAAQKARKRAQKVGRKKARPKKSKR